METKKKPSAGLEFLVIILLIVFAVIFAWNLNVGSIVSNTSSSAKSTDSDNTTTKTATNKWQAGKELFKSNCAACHNPKADGTGPILIGVRNRWQAAGTYKGKDGKQWLHAWVRNWNDPVDAGYQYAVNMANSRISVMNPFPYLKDEEIEQIFDYIDSTAVPVVKASAN